jgi:hypothetical protein
MTLSDRDPFGRLRVIAIVGCDVDGGVYVDDEEGNRVVTVPPSLFTDNDMFDEGDWSTDSTATYEIVGALLAAKGFDYDGDRLKRAVVRSVEPGPPFDPADFRVALFREES